MLKKEQTILGSIILVAVLVRFFFLWAGRPEFVGWFNHTYYYYVQTKGLLNSGDLPYPDMPLLFYLYAISAKIISWAGFGLNTAIVSATRFWMCIIPSLIPIPVYFGIKKISKREKLDFRFWLIVCASAFLPLSILHLPEFSQKNVLGLLLLLLFMIFTKTTLDSFSFKKAMFLIILSMLILLTHFGTTAALLLYVFSIFLALIVSKEKAGVILKFAGIGLSGLFGVLAAVYLLDFQRFERIIFYLSGSIKSSFLGTMFTASTTTGDKSIAALSIIIPIGILLFFFKEFKKHTTSLNKADHIFWLSNILFVYLLALPVYDQLLFARLVLFVSLPLIFILAYLLKYANWKNWLKNALLTFMIFGVFLMLFGEFMSLKMHNRDKEVIYEDITTMQRLIPFTANDLILTKNGAEHICNWFLGTKAGVITALHRKDFAEYSTIYILNPEEGRLDFGRFAGKRADNERDKYLFMMNSIPEPENATTIYESDYLQLYKITEAPQEWEFSADGYWMSYGF